MRIAAVRLSVVGVLALAIICLSAAMAPAGLVAYQTFNGNVGLSVDAVGSNQNPVGQLQAAIPAGSTILKAYLYAAGSPYPWYSDSPQTAADYNGAGITLAGNAVTNFDTIVGAVSARPEIGKFYTGRADVTKLVSSLATGGPNYSWSYSEGQLNNRIDGGVLVIAYSNPASPKGSVVLLDGGQATAGETTTFHFTQPLGDVGAPGFYANMGIADSFSTGGGTQVTSIDVNGKRLTSSAGGLDDGTYEDGGLITAGGIGDSTDNPADPNSVYSSDDELYSLVPFLKTGDTTLTLFTQNGSADDNIFFMGLDISAEVTPPNVVPEPASLIVWSLLAGVAVVFGWRRRNRA